MFDFDFDFCHRSRINSWDYFMAIFRLFPTCNWLSTIGTLLGHFSLSHFYPAISHDTVALSNMERIIHLLFCRFCLFISHYWRLNNEFCDQDHKRSGTVLNNWLKRVKRSYWRRSAFKKSGSVKIKTIFSRGWWKKENKRCWRSWNCRQVDHSNESHTSTSQENRTYVFKRNATKATILNIWIKSIPHCLLFAYSIGFYSESCKQLIVYIELIIEWSFIFCTYFWLVEAI